MPDWTDIEITRLIACSKSVSVAPKKEMKEEFRHRRNDMKLGSGGGEQFEVFMRQSLEFQEDFSIGLVFLSPEGKSILLIRFNGQHDQANE